MKLIKPVLINLISLVVICAPSWAVETDENGDYIFPNIERRGEVSQLHWVVTDSDPEGLNCRMAEEYQGIPMDSIDAPSILYKHYHHAISDWSVVTTFKAGEQLLAIINNFGNNIVLLDDQGKPWIPVESELGDLSDCFVRANRRFIAPILKDP